jgi:hypothetical protein
MKKIIILLLMLPIMVQAQIKLQPKVAMSYGHEKIRLMDEQMGRYDYHLPNFCFRTGLDVKYKKLTVYYDVKVWASNSSWRFTPTQATYEVGVTYQVADKIKISASHTCYHPIATDNGVARGGMFGGGDVVTISYGY